MSQPNPPPISFSPFESAYMPSGKNFARLHLAFDVNLPGELHSEAINTTYAAIDQVDDDTQERRQFEKLDDTLARAEEKLREEEERYEKDLHAAAISGAPLPKAPDPRRVEVLRDAVDAAAKTADRKKLDLQLQQANEVLKNAKAELAEAEVAISQNATPLALAYLSKKLRVEAAERAVRETWSKREEAYKS